MKITALAPWFGSKRNLAPEIVRELGPHKAYWEPFCGSMAALFAKPKCRLETVNDLHGDLINLARVVREPVAAKELYDRARFVFCADEELRLADSVVRNVPPGDADSVDRALQYLIVCWQGRNGECGLSQTERAKSLCIRWTNNGGAPGTRWHGAVRSIGAWHRRLETVTITKRCGFEMLEKIADEPDGAIYVDPPYIDKSDSYLHDFKPDDHKRLAELLGRFRRARVVVSYYSHPIVDGLYAGWTQRRIEVAKATAHSSARGENTKKAIEVLLINGPSYTTERQLF